MLFVIRKIIVGYGEQCHVLGISTTPVLQSQGTQAREKNKLLLKEFGIDYNTLPLMFRQGSSIFRVKVASPPSVQCYSEYFTSYILRMISGSLFGFCAERKPHTARE